MLEHMGEQYERVLISPYPELFPDVVGRNR